MQESNQARAVHSDARAAEILCVGTELLLGNILNGNARWLAEQLASLGVPHHRQLVVGDNRAVMRAAQVLLNQGVWVTGIRTPTVPHGTARLRITFSAAHTQADVARLLQGLSALSFTHPMTIAPEAV